MSRKTIMTIYKTIYLLSLAFGNEFWVITQKLESRLQKIEMKYLRKVVVVTWEDHVRNDHIRKELKIKSVI